MTKYKLPCFFMTVKQFWGFEYSVMTYYSPHKVHVTRIQTRTPPTAKQIWNQNVVLSYLLPGASDRNSDPWASDSIQKLDLYFVSHIYSEWVEKIGVICIPGALYANAICSPVSVSIDWPSGITGTGLLHLPNYIACLGQWLFHFSCYVDCSYRLQLQMDVNVKSRIKNDWRYLICEDQSASFSWFSEYKSEKGIIFDSLAHNFCLTLVVHFISKTRHHIWKKKSFPFYWFSRSYDIK